MKFRSAMFLVLCTTLCASPAFAKKPDQPGTKGKHHQEMSDQSEKQSETISIAFRFDESSRQTVQTYLRENNQTNCPPGLAKKNNGCLPLGIAKKYSIGGRLPHNHAPLPGQLLERLGPAPAGAFYAMVDKDVVLVSLATQKILDAVTLLSAIE